MSKVSAGILLVRIVVDGGGVRSPEMLLVHPGGPFWRNKDAGVWSIPKGEYEPPDDPLATAMREFEEELGTPCPTGELVPIGTVRQAGGKVVTAWYAVGELDVSTITSNTFEIQWPPRSGRMQRFPEVDRAEFFAPDDARVKILPAQAEFIDRALDGLRDAGRL